MQNLLKLETIKVTVPECLNRQSHCTVEWRDYLYVFGGYNAEYLSCMYRYHTLKKNWEPVRINGTTSPGKKSGHSCSVYRDVMYCFAGKGNDYDRVSDLWEFNFLTNTWELIEPKGEVPNQRSSQTSVIYKDMMLIFGGFNGYYTNSMKNDLYTYYILQKTWKRLHTEGELPPPRVVHKAFVYRDSMYICTGENDERAFNDLWEFNIPLKKWKNITTYCDIPSPRCAAGGALYHHYYILFGGEAAFEVCNDGFYILDLLTLKWKNVRVENVKPRSDFTLNIFGNKLYIMGGMCTDYYTRDFIEMELEKIDTGFPLIENVLQSFIDILFNFNK